MARPPRTTERRAQLIPRIAQAFAELGYRRATTAELARRCGVRENILYRLWADKKAMFIAAIGYVYEQSAELWNGLITSPGEDRSPAEALLRHEAEHFGELGHYRIIFAGLSETDDPDIRAALADMYGRYHAFIRDQIRVHRGAGNSDDAVLTAWTLIGLGTIASITREFGLAADTQRRALFSQLGQRLLDQGRAN